MKPEFCEHWPSDNRTLLTDINEFLPLLSEFIFAICMKLGYNKPAHNCVTFHLSVSWKLTKRGSYVSCSRKLHRLYLRTVQPNYVLNVKNALAKSVHITSRCTQLANCLFHFEVAVSSPRSYKSISFTSVLILSSYLSQTFLLCFLKFRTT